MILSITDQFYQHKSQVLQLHRMSSQRGKCPIDYEMWLNAEKHAVTINDFIYFFFSLISKVCLLVFNGVIVTDPLRCVYVVYMTHLIID